MKSYYARKRQQLMSSAYTDIRKWERMEKKLGRAMTSAELKQYIGWMNRKGHYQPPKENDDGSK